MNRAMDKLLEADRQAREILDSAEAYQAKAMEEITAAKQALRQQYEEKAQRHIQDVREACQQEADRASVEIKARYSALAAAMEQRFDETRSQWQQELLQRCIGE